MQSPPNLSGASITFWVITILVSAGIGALTSLAATWLNTRSEERKHFRALIVNAALEYWKKRSDYIAGEGGQVFPLAPYLIYTKKLCDVCFDKNLNSSNLEAKLEEAEKLSRMAEAMVIKNHLRGRQ